MSNDSKALAIIPRTVGEVESLAAKFSKSSLMPDALRGKEADVFVSIMAGQELGLTPMAALRGVHVVKGRPILSADTMVALVLGSGLAEFFRPKGDATSTSATYETRRKGDTEIHTCTWTIEDAKRAQIDGGDNWRKHPRSMLKARAKAMLARDIYPDVLAGCYEEDEAREFVQSGPPEGSQFIDAEVVEVDPLDKVADDLIAEVQAATTLDVIESLAARFAALPKGTPQRQRAAAAYKTAKEDAARHGVEESAA